MVDILGMMKKAQELQGKMAEMQDRLGDLIVEGRSGGGLVCCDRSPPSSSSRASRSIRA